MRTQFLLVIASIVTAGPLAAQMSACVGGPGGRFGITAFQCGNCTVTHDDRTGRVRYDFASEPLVSRTAAGSELAEGDVLEAVDSLPITTAAGAERFLFPGPGMHALSVRRGRERTQVSVRVVPCTGTSSSTSSSSASGTKHIQVWGFYKDDGIHYGSGSGSGTGIGDPVLGGARLVVTTSKSAQGSMQGTGVTTASVEATDDVGRFGFATACRPSCSAKKLPDGRYVLKYNGYPVVAIIREKSVAEQDGLRLGDEILTVNGRSILDDDALEGAASRNDLRLTVRRDGKELVVNLEIRKSVLRVTPN